MAGGIASRCCYLVGWHWLESLAPRHSVFSSQGLPFQQQRYGFAAHHLPSCSIAPRDDLPLCFTTLPSSTIDLRCFSEKTTTRAHPSGLSPQHIDQDGLFIPVTALRPQALADHLGRQENISTSITLYVEAHMARHSLFFAISSLLMTFLSRACEPKNVSRTATVQFFSSMPGQPYVRALPRFSPLHAKNPGFQLSRASCCKLVRLGMIRMMVPAKGSAHNHKLGHLASDEPRSQ